MKALISSIEPRGTGYRVAEVVADDSTFSVAEPDMFWTDFPSNLEPTLVSQDKYWYDPSDSTIKLIPQPEITLEA